MKILNSKNTNKLEEMVNIELSKKELTLLLTSFGYSSITSRRNCILESVADEYKEGMHSFNNGGQGIELFKKINDFLREEGIIK